jgi:hypothetical protein
MTEGSDGLLDEEIEGASTTTLISTAPDCTSRASASPRRRCRARGGFPRWLVAELEARMPGYNQPASASSGRVPARPAP